MARANDPEICGICTVMHGCAGTRCARHNKYIERRPLAEERTDEDREAEANQNPAVAMPKILELLKLDAEDGEDPVARVRELVKMHEAILDLYEDNFTPAETSGMVKVTFDERAAAFDAIYDHMGDEPSDAADVKKVIERFADDSAPKGSFVELLALVGMTEHDYECESHRFPVMSPVAFLVERLRKLAPQLLAKPPRKRRVKTA